MAQSQVAHLVGVGRTDPLFTRIRAEAEEAARHEPELAAFLLTSILNPSYAIEPHYVHYVVTTKDGEIHDGVIANETPGSITLRGGTENGDETILRTNIAEIRASSVSLMPEGLEKSMNRQDIADVIAYLRAGL